MKFLCVKCDEQMTLKETVSHDDLGSLSVVYGCAACGSETAMLTNSFETQLVRSLGVSIGPKAEGGGSKCPFSAMVSSGDGAKQESVEASGGMHSPGGVSSAADSNIRSGSANEAGVGYQWTDGARSRLERIPEMIRPMAKMGIEHYAKDRGYARIDEAVLDEAKDKFGM